MTLQPTELPGAPGSCLDAEVQTDIRSVDDVLTARRIGRSQATALGLDVPDVTLLAAAISEVARNIVDHAKGGRMTMRVVNSGGRRGLRIVARDQGPGIADIARATQYGSSPDCGPRVGLPGARLLVDEFDIISGAGGGTTVTMTKWLHS